MKVIIFSAVWCPTCIVMNARWEKIQHELPWVEKELYDYDRDKEKRAVFNVGSQLPVFIFLGRDGKEFARKQGEIDRRELVSFLLEHRDN